MSNVVVKYILSQDLDGKRGKWIVVILEYDLEIKPTKLIKGQGLAQLMAESNLGALDINMVVALDEQQGLPDPTVEEKFQSSPWYYDILYVLTHLNAPPELSKTKARFLKIKARNYCILNKFLYWKSTNGLLLKCFLENEVERNKQEFHARECGGHLNWKATANKILRAGYYWPKIFNDIHKMIISCHKCHIFEG